MLEIFKMPMRIKELRRENAQMQHSISILLGDQVTTSSTSTGNPYPGYKQAITELSRKYEGIAEWGIQQVRNIIDIRSAFVVGQGIKLVQKDKSQTKSREMQFLEEFVKTNDLDEEGPLDLAKESEIEGRCLVKLIPSPTVQRQVEYRFVSYSVNGYKIETVPDDYKQYTQATYRDSANQKDVVLDAKDFVYKKFAGRIDKVNDIMPKLGMVLRQCEDLDKALADWRKINKLFAAPTPYFKCADANEAAKLAAAIKETNWKIGKSFCGTAEFSLVGMTDSGKESLEQEIITNAKMISGAVGVPVHFLGFPDLMSNRSTSTDLFEFINASTAKERKVWAGFYEELFDKAIAVSNTQNKGTLKPGLVTVELLQITDAKMKELTDIWMPLYTNSVIDLDYMLSKIPDINVEQVKAAKTAEEQRMLQSIKDEEARASQGGAQ